MMNTFISGRGYRAWYGSDIITYCKTWPIAMSHPAGFYKVPRSRVLVDWNFAENNYNNEEVVATGTITVPAAKLRIRPTTSFKNKLWEGNTVTVDYSYLLNPGDKVNIVSLEKAGAKKDYYKIVFSTKSSVVPVQYMRDKNILYVSSYYVDVVDPKVTRPTGMTAGKIQKLGTGKVFKIYSEKSTASTVIGNVGNNGIVNVINMEPVQENGAYWVEVWFSNQRGYIKFNKAENVPTYIKSHTHSFAKDWTVIQKATTKADGMIGHKCTVKNADGSACEEYGDKTVVPKIASVKLTPSSVTFNGKKQKPKLVIKDAEGNDITKYFSKTVRYGKNVGIYITTIASKSLPSDPQNIYNRYSMKESLEFKVNPVGTDISSLGKGTKAFTVKWKKQTTDIGRKMEGYQIRYSTSSKMNKSKTKTVKVTYNSHPASLTIKNLAAKKKYYVQIRTYCTVSKTKLYSGWSEVKTVTTK